MNAGCGLCLRINAVLLAAILLLQLSVYAEGQEGNQGSKAPSKGAAVTWPNALQQNAGKPTVINPTAVKATPISPHAVKPTTVKPTTVKPTEIKSIANNVPPMKTIQMKQIQMKTIKRKAAPMKTIQMKTPQMKKIEMKTIKPLPKRKKKPINMFDPCVPSGGMGGGPPC